MSGLSNGCFVPTQTLGNVCNLVAIGGKADTRSPGCARRWAAQLPARLRAV
jgi:hypothetical protein